MAPAHAAHQADLSFLLNDEGVSEDTMNTIAQAGIVSLRVFARFADSNREMRVACNRLFGLDEAAAPEVALEVARLVSCREAAGRRVEARAAREAECSSQNIPRRLQPLTLQTDSPCQEPRDATHPASKAFLSDQ